MRREISIESYSLKAPVAERSELSTNSVTSAMLRAGRAAEPEKMTSSISLPRTDVGRVSPITQRSASNRLDFPQPLGPTTAVNPGSTKSSVGSTNDLNPESLSRVNFKEMRRPTLGPLLLGQERIQLRLQDRPGHATRRSEERRVGKECRSRRWT